MTRGTWGTTLQGKSKLSLLSNDPLLYVLVFSLKSQYITILKVNFLCLSFCKQRTLLFPISFNKFIFYADCFDKSNVLLHIYKFSL